MIALLLTTALLYSPNTRALIYSSHTRSRPGMVDPMSDRPTPFPIAKTGSSDHPRKTLKYDRTIHPIRDRNPLNDRQI